MCVCVCVCVWVWREGEEGDRYEDVCTQWVKCVRRGMQKDEVIDAS